MINSICDCCRRFRRHHWYDWQFAASETLSVTTPCSPSKLFCTKLPRLEIHKLPLLCGIQYFYLRPSTLRLIDGSYKISYSGAGLDEYPLPDPTRTFFLLPELHPNYFSKFPSSGFFPVSCFPADCFKSFNKSPQILLFLVVLT